MLFDNLLIYGQRLLLLFRREHNQYQLQTPNELDSVAMPMCCMLSQGKKRLTEEMTLGYEGYAISYHF